MPMIPLWGSGVKAKSSNVTSQERINLYVEQSDDKSDVVLYSRPGLVDACQNVTMDPGINGVPDIYSVGARGVMVLPTGGYYWTGSDLLRSGYNDVVVGISGNTAFGIIGKNSIFRSGGEAFLNSGIETTSGPVSIAASTGVPVSMSGGLYELFMVDGKSCYTLLLNGVSGAITVTNLRDETAIDVPYGATSVCSIAGRIVANDPSVPGRFRWSPVGWAYYNTPVGWDALDYATAESNADALPAVWESNGELVLWGMSTTEFWAPTGGTEVFARTGGAGIQWGIAAVQSLAKFGGGTIFLGRNAGGNRQVGVLTGYQVQVVSTPDIDYEISKDPSPDLATGYVATIGGHSFYVLNLSARTWVYDITTGVWAEWQTEDGKFIGQFGVSANGYILVNDYRNLKWYSLEQDVYKDGDAPMVRELTSRHLFHDLNRLTVWELALDAETGVGNDAVTNPQIMLQVSKDGGHTFGNELWQSLGRVGDYLKRVVWKRLGRGRDFVFRFRVSDPVKVTLIGSSVRVE